MESHDSEFSALTDAASKTGKAKSAKSDKPERLRGKDAVVQSERSSLLHIVSSAFGEAGLLINAINPHYGEAQSSDEVFHAGLDEVIACVKVGVHHLVALHEIVCHDGGPIVIGLPPEWMFPGNTNDEPPF